MRTKMFFMAMVMILGIYCLSSAQDTAVISVEDIQICTSVEDHMPVGTDSTFSSGVEKLYCYNRIINGGGNSITHVWYFNDKEMARVELSVGADSWRTWSTKKIMPGWVGFWRVDVLSVDGNVIASKKFAIE